MSTRQALPPLADVLIEGSLDADFSPNRHASHVTLQETPAVLIRNEGWKEGDVGPVWSEDVAAELVAHLRYASQENLLVFLLDGSKRLVGIYEHSRGGAMSTGVYQAHVLKMVLLTGASFVVLCHNHPTGDPTASPADKKTTRMVGAGLARVGAQIYSHLVVGEEAAEEILLTGGAGVRVRKGAVAGLFRVAVAQQQEEMEHRTRRPYGPYAKWLVQAGIVRPAGLRAARAAYGSLQIVEKTQKIAIDAWSSGRTEKVLLIHVDGILRITSVVLTAITQVDQIATLVLEQGLLSGGHQVFVVRRSDKPEPEFAMALLDAMRSFPEVQLLDVQVFDGTCLTWIGRRALRWTQK